MTKEEKKELKHWNKISKSYDKWKKKRRKQQELIYDYYHQVNEQPTLRCSIQVNIYR